MIVVDETIPVGEPPPPFPKKDVEINYDEDMRDSYELKREIGRGRFGTVYLCNCKTTGLQFAAKFVNTKRNQDRKNVEREIELMKLLNTNRPHPKLIQLYDAFDMGKQMCLVLEVVDGGELFERVIDDDFILTERACAIFIRQICEGIEYIHSQNVLHLDMKPENILCLSRQGNRIKICDFGLARKYDPRKKLQVLFGTPEFVAPEVVNFDPIGYGTDLWSVGVICYVLISGLSPFMGHNYVETMTNVTHNKYDFNDEAFDDVSDDVIDFIEKLLILDKNERLTPDQCLRHQWMKKMLCNAPTQQYEEKPKEAASSEVSSTETEIANKPVSEKEDATTKDSSTPLPTTSEVAKTEETPPPATPEITKIEDPPPQEKESSTLHTDPLNIPSNANINNTSINKEESLNMLKKTLEEKKDDSFQKVQSPKNSEGQLDTAKKQMKEFVERWNSHPNSPYLVGSPTIPSHVYDRALSENWDSTISSFDSLETQKPITARGPDDTRSTIIDSTKDPHEVAKQLEERLTDLQIEEAKDGKTSRRASNSNLGKPEVITIKMEVPGMKLKRQDALRDSTKEGACMFEKEQPAIKLKPSRDVPIVIEKKNLGVSERETPEAVTSTSTTPLRRSRRTSKDESSFSKESSSQAYSYRRPSRDVPSAAVITGRLNGILSPDHPKEIPTAQEMWPDAFCISQDKDSDEDVPIPITAKLELPVVVSQNAELQDTDAAGKRKSFGRDKSQSLDDQGLYKVENKKAAWVLNIEKKEKETDLLKPSPNKMEQVKDRPKSISPISNNTKPKNSPSPDHKLTISSEKGIKMEKQAIQVNKKAKEPPLYDDSSKKQENSKPRATKSPITRITNETEKSKQVENSPKSETSLQDSDKTHTDKKASDKNKSPEYDQTISEKDKTRVSPNMKKEDAKENKSGTSVSDTEKYPSFGKHNQSPTSDKTPIDNKKSHKTPQDVSDKEKGSSSSIIKDSSLKNDTGKENKKPGTSLSVTKKSLPFEKSNQSPTPNKNEVDVTSHSIPKDAKSSEQINRAEKSSVERKPSRPPTPKPLLDDNKAKPQTNDGSPSSTEKTKKTLSSEKINLPKSPSTRKSSSRTNSYGQAKVSLTPRSSTELERPGSSKSSRPSSSQENLDTVHTPWGPMRRSPSRGSIKSAEKNVIVIDLSKATTQKISSKDESNTSTATTNKQDSSKPRNQRVEKQEEEKNIQILKSQENVTKKISDRNNEFGDKPVLKKSKDTYLYSDNRKAETKDSSEPPKVEETIVPIKIDISYEELFNDTGSPKLVVEKKKSLPCSIPITTKEEREKKSLSRSKSPFKKENSPPKTFMLSRKNSHDIKAPTKDDNKNIPSKNSHERSSYKKSSEPQKDKLSVEVTNKPSADKALQNKPKSPVSPISPGLRSSATIGGGINKLFTESSQKKLEITPSMLKPVNKRALNSSYKAQDTENNEPKFKLNKRNSLIKSDNTEEPEENSVVRRKSRSSPPPSGKNSFRMSLFSAQDRISLFETKQDAPPTRTFRPISRSKTSTVLNDPTDSNSHNSNRSSFYEKTKPQLTNSIYTRV